jgi:hypothetical protein
VSIKMQYTLTTLPTVNEQSGVSPITVTATGTSREYPEFGAFSSGIFFLHVTAVSGTTPSLTVIVQGYNPIAEVWHTVVSFPAQTTTTATVLTPITSTLDYMRYRTQWTVSGTSPSFTFSCGVIVNANEAIT